MVSDIRMPEMDGLTLLLHQETVQLIPGAAPLVEGRGEGAGALRRAVGIVWLAQARQAPHASGEEARRIGACRGIIVCCRTEATAELNQRRSHAQSPCRVAAVRALVHQHLLASHAIESFGSRLSWSCELSSA